MAGGGDIEAAHRQTLPPERSSRGAPGTREPADHGKAAAYALMRNPAIPREPAMEPQDLSGPGSGDSIAALPGIFRRPSQSRRVDSPADAEPGSRDRVVPCHG